VKEKVCFRDLAGEKKIRMATWMTQEKETGEVWGRGGGSKKKVLRGNRGKVWNSDGWG